MTAGGRAAVLARLAGLARLKSEAEIARLAATAQSRGRLIAALAALGAGEAPLGPPPEGGAGGEAPGAAPPPVDPALVRARLAHRAWIEGQRRHLNARLAMVEADWRRLQPVAARAFGRTRVLDDLTERAEDEARARKLAAATQAPR